MNTFLSIIFLLAFLVLIATVLSMLMGALFHMRQRVVFVPSTQAALDAMIEAAKLTGTETVMDLGAGDARFLIALKKQFPTINAIGYEGAYWVWLLGKLRLYFTGSTADFLHCDFFKQDLSSADVIFTYLSPEAMKKLLPKLQKEMKMGARLITNAFELHGVQEERVIDVTHRIGKSRIWLYRAPLTTSSAPTESET